MGHEQGVAQDERTGISGGALSKIADKRKRSIKRTGLGEGTDQPLPATEGPADNLVLSAPLSGLGPLPQYSAAAGRGWAAKRLKEAANRR